MMCGIEKPPRQSICEALVDIAKADERVVVLDGEVSNSTMTYLFRDAHPERFFTVGIAEQNMMTMAAGLATQGYIPFVSTFACFVTRRCMDQISISVAYPNLNVKINASYGGVPVGKSGATHQAFEDIALMRAIPNMTVLDLCDDRETKLATKASVEHCGPVYLRTVRCDVPSVFGNDYEFKIGKGYKLHDGDDVTIISSGMMTPKAMDAIKQLKANGVYARHLHYPTIKPLDESLIIKAAKETGKLITIENHSIVGGLGSAVAEVVAEKAPARLVRLGVKDTFGESGDDEAFFTKYDMNVESIVQAAMKICLDGISVPISIG